MRKRFSTLGAAVVFLLEFGGAGMSVAFPQFRLVGFILMAIGVLPLLALIINSGRAWLKSRHKRKSRKPEGSDLNWLPMLAAIEAFCDSQFVTLKNGYLGSAESTIDKIFQVDDEIRACKAQEGQGTQEERDAAAKQRGDLVVKRGRLEHMQELAYSGVKDMWKTLRDDLCERLLSGELIAKGLAEPYVGGAPDIVIRRAEWQTLTVSPSDASAVKKGDLKPVYTALQIARAWKPNAATPSSLLPKIEIMSAGGAPYEMMQMVGERTRSYVKIGLKNGGDITVSNCAVTIEKVIPDVFRAAPIKLEAPEFNLRHDDPEKFIEVAEYWGHAGKIRFCELPSTFSGPRTYFDAGQRYQILVKVRASETTRSALFDLWVDPSSQLRLQFVADTE